MSDAVVTIAPTAALEAERDRLIREATIHALGQAQPERRLSVWTLVAACVVGLAIWALIFWVGYAVWPVIP